MTKKKNKATVDKNKKKHNTFFGGLKSKISS